MEDLGTDSRAADGARDLAPPAEADPGAPSSRYRDTETYLSAFQASVERHPEAIALECTTLRERWSYRQVDELTDGVAGALRAAGLGRGQAVMCSAPNRAEFVFLWLGTQKAGGVFAPINPRLAPGEVARHLEDSAPHVYAFDVGLSGVARGAVERSTHRVPVLIELDGAGRSARGPDASLGPHEALPWSRFAAEGSGTGTQDPLPEAKADRDDEVLRLYRLGPLGEPLGVPCTNLNCLARAFDIIMHLPLGTGTRTLNMTPWFHAGGLQVAGPSPTFLAGGRVVAVPRFDADSILDLVEAREIGILVGVPFTFELLARVQERSPRDLSSLDAIVSMGARLEPAACDRLREVFGPELYNGYGTTETFWNTILRPEAMDAHAGTAGRACTADRVRVIRRGDPDRPADPDELVARDGTTEGEVIIRSPKTPAAYHGRPDHTRRWFRDGWFYTDDIGTWDADGFIDVRGRWDGMIIAAGENVHPGQVRTVLLAHPGIEDALVVGVPDPLRGQTIAAWVVPSDPSLDTAELKPWLTSHPDLARFKRPRLFRFVDRLPEGPRGRDRDRWLRLRAAEEVERGLFSR